MYRQYNLKVNHKNVQRLMYELGIREIKRRKYIHRTSYEAAVSDGGIQRISCNKTSRLMALIKSGLRMLHNTAYWMSGSICLSSRICGTMESSSIN
ncbi:MULTISPECIES: transposase [Bacillales]|uniref:transposase n=1 Tax=Bacillales TaxID=1385 RepID=UPI00159ED330